MSNSLGAVFRVTSFGESHGRCVGTVVDGCPAGLRIEEASIQRELDRRRPGQGKVTTLRGEADRLEILSGVFERQTTGAPIAMLVWNSDADSSAYDTLSYRPRPGHADYPAWSRYGGFNDHRGGGRFSGRITAGFVMAGAVAKALLATVGVEVLAYSSAIGGVEAPEVSLDEARANTEKTPVRCPHLSTAGKMADAIEAARLAGNSVGGEVSCVAIGLPAGLGQPVFDTVEGDIAKALFAVPAVKAVEFGTGAHLASMMGSEANDPYVLTNGKVATTSNNMGGVLGGLTNGMPVTLRCAFKPTPSISLPQETVDLSTMQRAEIEVKGRHDPCIVPRAVPVVEAMVAIVLADHGLRAGLIPQVLKSK